MLSLFTKNLTTWLILPGVIIGSIFVSCHSLVGGVDRSHALSVVEITKEECCKIQNHNDGPHVISLVTESMLRLPSRHSVGTTTVHSALNPANTNEFFGGVLAKRSQAGRSPTVKLHSYLSSLFSQGILNSKIFDLA